MNLSPNHFSIARKAISLTLLLSFVFTNLAAAATFAADTKQMSPTPAVAKYTTDLTQLGRNGSLRENLNLEKETLRVLEVLGKGGSRQPVILDEKSENQEAVAEQVAIRMAAGNVPRSLSGKKLLKLDVSSLYANSTSDAEVAAKMNEVATAAASSNGAIILFIDELPRFVGPAQTSVLTAALQQRKLQIVGGSSTAFFNEMVSDSPELAALFETINVGDAAKTAEKGDESKPKNDSFAATTSPQTFARCWYRTRPAISASTF